MLANLQYSKYSRQRFREANVHVAGQSDLTGEASHLSSLIRAARTAHTVRAEYHATGKGMRLS
jgi:hypothetical protein